MKPGFPYIIAECKARHRWPVIVPPWWSWIRHILCPKCHKKAVAMKWGGLADNLKEGVLIEQVDGTKE